MGMNHADLDRAIYEAQRFIEKAKLVKFDSTLHAWPLDHSKTAACKRASMDLTRALANIRESR